jgi:hypothetical protein
LVDTSLDIASLLAICGGRGGLRKVIDMNYSSFAETAAAAEPTKWLLGEFNVSGFVEASSVVDSEEFASALGAMDEFGGATALPRKTLVVEVSTVGEASAFGEPTGVEASGFHLSLVDGGSLFGERTGIDAPTSTVDLSFGDRGSQFEPTLGIVVSSIHPEFSGAPGLTNDVAGSEPEDWTLTVDSSAQGASLGREPTEVEATHFGATEGLARSEVDAGATPGGVSTMEVKGTATGRGPQPSGTKSFDQTGRDFVTRSLASTEDGDTQAGREISQLAPSQVIRITSILVTPATGGSPTMVWTRLESAKETPLVPSGSAVESRVATADGGEATATSVPTFVQPESEGETPVAASVSVSVSAVESRAATADGGEATATSAPDRKSTRLNSSHLTASRMPSSA